MAEDANSMMNLIKCGTKVDIKMDFVKVKV